jgi:hypothetical protein
LPNWKSRYPASVVGALDRRNIFLWFNMTEEAVAAMQGLISDGLIHGRSAHILVYLCDGMIPQVPLAKQARAYKEPRWAPTVFSLGPGPKKTARGRSTLTQGDEKLR